MIKIYEEKVFWVLVLLLGCVAITLFSVRLCQIISERSGHSANRIVIIDERGDITIVNSCEDSDPESLETVKQSYENLAPPDYSTISRAGVSSTYELPPPYPYKIEHI